MTTIRPRDSWDIPTGWTPPELNVTRLTLTPEGQRLNPRELHTMIAWAYDGSGRVLWVQPRRDLLICQAASEPRLDRLVGIIADAAVNQYSPSFEAGQRVELSGVMNPTQNVPCGNRKTRRSHLPPDLHADWWNARLHGVVTVEEVRVEQIHPIKVRKPGHLVTIARSGFHSLGTVIDPTRLAWLVANGVGDGRAYGCGLLLAVAR